MPAFSCFLNMALDSIHHLAWPLLALAYPLCASVQAIETDSYSQTRDLISYWILFSLLYLFDYAFRSLLSWFWFWPFAKLMIILCLVIPDFRQASYVYNTFIRPCIMVKLPVVISKLNTWRKHFAKKENFLLHAERYIQENGTEALEKLIASKITAHNPDAEATNTNAADKKEMQQAANTITAAGRKETQQAIDTSSATEKKETQATNNTSSAADTKGILKATMTSDAFDKKEMQQASIIVNATNKKETLQTNGSRPETEHKDIKELEVIERKEDSAGKHDSSVMANLSLNHNNPSVTMETNGTTSIGTTGGELHPSTTKEVQKEWTCALCQVTTTCEKNLNAHLLGMKHKATLEALKEKSQPSLLKPKNDQSNKVLKQKNTINQLANIADKNIQSVYAEGHAQAIWVLEKSVLNVPVKRSVHAPKNESKNGECISNNGLKGKVDINHEKVQGLQKNLHKPVMMNKSKSRCEACNVTCTSEVDLASHLIGRKHLTQIRTLSEADNKL